MCSRKDNHCQGKQWTDVKKKERTLGQMLSNFFKSQHTASVQLDGEDDQPAVEDESLNEDEDESLYKDGILFWLRGNLRDCI